MSDDSNQDLQNSYNEAYGFLEGSEIANDRPKILPGDSDNEKYLKQLLQDIQGNILKGHGRVYSIYLFLHFDSNPQKQQLAKKWIGNFAEKYVTSAVKQQEQSKQRQEYIKNNTAIPKKLKLFVNFSLSFKGYKALGLDVEKNFQKPRQQKIKNLESPFLPQHSFEQGMLESLVSLKDDRDEWEPEYRQFNNEIHALILIAESDPSYLWKQTNKIIKEIEVNQFAIVKKEIGCVRRNNLNQAIEPFGFPDGISQPLFLKPDIEKIKNTDKWNPNAPLRLVLNVDPFGKQFKDKLTGDEYSFGSFLVYRKLEQNVDGFNEKVRELSCKLEKQEKNCQPKEETQQLVRAFIVGRFREDGSPVVIHSQPGFLRENEIIENNFNYGKGENFSDLSQWKCPFHAHIRKANSRAINDDKVFTKPPYKDTAEDQRNRRIVRRGVTYGLPKSNQYLLLSPTTKDNFKYYKKLSKNLGVELEEGKEGVLFFCFQSDIAVQFEKLQDYTNDRDFGPNMNQNLGADPISGQKDEDEDREWPSQTWPRKWGDSKDPVKGFEFFGFVTPRGGEYFFTPSLSFLKSLKSA